MRNPSPAPDLAERASRAQLIKEIAVALGWSLLLGLPLFVLHMLLFDFEHAQHMGNTFSTIASMTDMIPRHPVSLALWLSAIFIAVFALRRAFQQQALLIRAQEKMTLAHTQALTDGLTGVWNRLGFELLLEETLTQAQNLHKPFSIILGDVDRLKDYNDTHGHPAADVALRQVARILAAQIRAADAVARFGGDEFAIFCLDLDRPGALRLVDRLTEALRAAPLTMSFGVAVFPDDGEAASALLRAADQRLYWFKGERKVGGPATPQATAGLSDDGQYGVALALPPQRQPTGNIPE